MFRLPHFKESCLGGVSFTIQKIKDTLLALDCSTVGIIFIWLGLFIIGSVLCIHVFSIYGVMAAAIFFGVALMIIGLAIL